AATDAQPPPPASRVRDAPPGGRRRPAHDPGAARPRVAFDDADLQPRRPPPPPPGLRPRAPALLTRLRRRAPRAAESGPAAMSDRQDPDVESFLLLLAASRPPRTDDAHRGGPPAFRAPRRAADAYGRERASSAAPVDHPVGSSTAEEIEAWLATMRADGRAPATIARGGAGLVRAPARRKPQSPARAT